MCPNRLIVLGRQAAHLLNQIKYTARLTTSTINIKQNRLDIGLNNRLPKRRQQPLIRGEAAR